MNNGIYSPIGGYFELEIDGIFNNLHCDGLFVNSGRNALEYVILANGIKKLYVPRFTCKVVLEPLIKHEVVFEFYNIDENLEIADDIHLGNNDYLLYTNYFGIKDEYVRHLADVYQNRLVVDNAQALFANHIESTNSVYSPRKFVGMPDGGIAFSCNKLDMIFEQDISYERCTHLLKRHDLLPSEGYDDFRKDESTLANKDIMQMSKLSKKIYDSLHVKQIISCRKRNFECLSKFLSDTNLFEISPIDSFACPMVYPYYTKDENLRKKLISNDIFVATYWPNVLEWCDSNSVEYRCASYLLPLPIDQRYDVEDMKRIVNVVLNK